MKAIVLLSGGIDSTTCLAQAVASYGKGSVRALSFEYGQKHSNEIKNAAAVAAHYGVPLTIAKVDSQIFMGSDSTLLKGGGDIEHKSYADILEERGEGTVDTYVPFRNGLMLSQAAAFAYSVGAGSVWYGAHADDAAGQAYPDCTPDFYQAMDHAIFTGTGCNVNLYAPLIEMNKAGVVEMGLSLEAPYELTRSCYEGHDAQCGLCGTCRDRIVAFKLNGVKDEAAYEVEIDWEVK